MPTLAVSRGLTYYYQHFPPRLSDGKWILFLHGWPSAANDWHNQIDHFRQLGWGVLAPDLPGAGKTSRPIEVYKYVLKDVCRDVLEILDHEKISKVNAVGHDWGSILLSRLAVYYPERIERLCFIAVGYRPPGASFNLEAMNEMTRQKLGYPAFGYQGFFIEEKQAQEILDEHKDSIMSLMFAKDPSMWKVHLAPPGALEKYLKSDQQVEWADYMTDLDYQNLKENISDEAGGIPSLNWYRANGLNLNYEAEKGITEAQKSLTQETLMINCTHDAELDTAHWAQLEAPDGVNAALERFFG